MIFAKTSDVEAIKDKLQANQRYNKYLRHDTDTVRLPRNTKLRKSVIFNKL